MTSVAWNDEEDGALRELPLAARVIYLQGLKRYMDFETGLVGVKRKISLQSLIEVLYVPAHPGLEEESVSKGQVRRSIGWLERAGLVERRSIERKALIFFLPLADAHQSVQKKADTIPTQQADTIPTQDAASHCAGFEVIDGGKADTESWEKADTPLISCKDKEKELTNVSSKKKVFRAADMPELSEETANQLLELRKAKKAPMTAVAWSRLLAEFDRAGLSAEQGVAEMLMRGWQGFKAEWVSGRDGGRVTRRLSYDEFGSTEF